MKTVACMALAAAMSSSASAGFANYVVTKTSTSNSGVALDVYTLYARFDGMGANDTVLFAGNFNRVDGSAGNVFYHKDDVNGGVLSKADGSWAPQSTGSSTLNRPFDSFLTIGGNASATNTTRPGPSWPGSGSGFSWERPDLPSGFNIGWFNPNPSNLQGRVNVGENTFDVRLGQFVLDAGADGGVWNLRITFNSGVAGAPVQFAERTFNIPAPGAIAVLGLAGLAGRRRRS